ncbi:MAG: tRNA (adenosine(37)-N6)-threonylcarbamoyltransferase complex dimerization subunit type 1 TsaB [Clostridia bacterium]|jgi:tRNA threonylcarbamoyladenosine biosynthesis protein TsaB|nr:tRNA (adenosine(37)-N6)-threonylcarbamoyltransferase complex dimerization subunit type 1 TsaB [Clostridia bacterium]
MKILAIDASGNVVSAAIADDEKIIAECSLDFKMTHSQTLMPIVDELVKRTNFDLKTLDYIAVTSGPGSFTGLRIGAATAKGLAHGLNIKLVAVPTLETLAYNIFETDKYICPIMDARRQQVYNAVYKWENGRLKTILEGGARSIDEVFEFCKTLDNKTIFLGDGVKVYKDRINEFDNLLIAPISARVQRAACTAALALLYAKDGKAINGSDFAPKYFRKSQAERELEEKRSGGKDD